MPVLPEIGGTLGVPSEKSIERPETASRRAVRLFRFSVTTAESIAPGQIGNAETLHSESFYDHAAVQTLTF
jgi:hypothetical protein